MNTDQNNFSDIPLSEPDLQKELLQLIVGSWASQVVYAAAKLGVADALQNSTGDVEALSVATECDARALYRLLRALASLGMVAEVNTGRFALTPIGELLVSDHPKTLRSFAILCGADWHWRSWGGIVSSVKKGMPAFEQMYGVPLFEYLGAQPESAILFDQAMKELTAQRVPAILDVLEFPEAATIVDIGGGNGKLLSAILEKNQKLKGVLFDLPDAVERACNESHLLKLISEQRCRIIGGDFFSEISVEADIHLMKFIVHDWSDAEAVKILRNSRRALEVGGRLLLLEHVVLPGNVPQLATLVDMEMLNFGSGCERTEAEFRNLLSSSGFELVRVIETGSPLSIIEARAV